MKQSDTDFPAEDIRALSEQLRRLNSHRFIRIHNSTRRLVWFQFLRGLAFGLGSAVGATALVSLVVVMLSQIEFIPILGEYATQLIEEIQGTNEPQRGPGAIEER